MELKKQIKFLFGKLSNQKIKDATSLRKSNQNPKLQFVQSWHGKHKKPILNTRNQTCARGCAWVNCTCTVVCPPIATLEVFTACAVKLPGCKRNCCCFKLLCRISCNWAGVIGLPVTAAVAPTTALAWAGVPDTISRCVAACS
uniref:Uncharacterized protein n=1 Tax=Photinus pyralis TaxID=7054 RepID=A0A1Y1KYI2_PHOPY